MSILKWLGRSSTKELATGHISIAAEHWDVQIQPTPDAPAWVNGPVGHTGFALYYLAKCLHALGKTSAAQQVQQSFALAAILLQRGSDIEPFTSFFDSTGAANGRLMIDAQGRLSMITSFRVALAHTNEFVADSALVLLSHVVAALNAQQQRTLGEAILIMGEFWTTTAPAYSLRAMDAAPQTAVEHFRRNEDHPPG